jgi:hypothetical protein
MTKGKPMNCKLLSIIGIILFLTFVFFSHQNSEILIKDYQRIKQWTQELDSKRFNDLVNQCAENGKINRSEFNIIRNNYKIIKIEKIIGEYPET